jgi:hypothetical protein
MAVGVIDAAGAAGRFVFGVNDEPYDGWADDCPPPSPRRWHSVSAPPLPRVVVAKTPCTPHFGFNTNWSDSRCAKLHETLAQAAPAEPTAPAAPAPHCTLNLGVNRNWLDRNCAKLYDDSAAQAGPADQTTRPAPAPPCVLNLGVNRDWLDSNCAKLHDSTKQPAQTTGMVDRLRDIFSSVVHPADWQAYRPIVADVSFAIVLAVVLVVIALLCARLVWWIFEGRSPRLRRQESNQVSLLTPDPFAASVRTRQDPSDPRVRQARELADRANELQMSLFGQPQ